MKLFRFRLSSILIAFTVVALLLGYTQVRRRGLNQAFADLRASGCRMRFEDHWLWPVVPEEANIVFRLHPSGDYSLEKGTYTAQPLMSKADRIETFKALRSELLGLGVTDVWLLEERNEPASGQRVMISIALESIGLPASSRSRTSP
ncbi:MAG: hypothetical protein JNL18_04995 [Planctomycetaceae bacterium]|nr:hypothetical protein [Planctomycetaceae bacterium]